MNYDKIMFSALIPCYNYAHFLSDCLESIIAQTIGDWEAIVVDDASNKGDPEKETLKFKDPRIRFFRHNSNQGAGATFNTAFRYSRYSYVFLLSADDRLDPHFLERVVTILQAKPIVDVAMVNLKLFGDHEGVWEYPVRDAAAMTKTQWIPGPASIMKREIWEKAGGHYEGPELKSGNLDWDFWLSAIKEGLNVEHIPEPLYYYRMHGASITSRRAEEDYQIHEFMYHRHQEFFDRFGTGGEFMATGYLNSAEALWKKGERRRAVELLHEAWKLHSETPDVISIIRKEFESQGINIDAHRKKLEDQLKLAPDFGLSPSKENVFMYRDLGRIAAAQGDWRASEWFLLRTLAFMKNRENAANLCNLLGLVYIRMGEYDAAEQAFDLTPRFNPANRGVYLHRARLLYSRGLWKKSLNACLEGLEVLNGNRSLFMLLGELAAKQREEGWDEQEFYQQVTNPPIPEVPPLAENTQDDNAPRTFLYSSPLGRKIYWISRAKDLYDKYGNSDGGYDTLGNVIDIVSPRHLLEIGCGNGRNFPLYIAKQIPEVVGQDISDSALELAGKRAFPGIRLTEVPVAELNFPDNYFDLAVSNRVLQHIPPGDVQTVMAAICRMARYIYINEATPEELINTHEPFYMFIHDYRALFEAHDFKTILEMKADAQRRFLFGRKHDV